MNEKPTIDVNKVKPITKFIYTLGVLPTSYLMAMSYEEQITWLCNYIMQTLIPAINDDVSAVQELQGLYEDLQDYVNNYFDSLDVQQEINEKINELVANGTITALIATYINPYIATQNTAITNIGNQVTSLENQITSLASGSPAGVYDTLSDLTTDNPSHNKIYVVAEDGEWYYYDSTNSEWTSGGTYQASLDSTSLTDLENTVAKIGYVSPNIFDWKDDSVLTNYFYTGDTGQTVHANSNNTFYCGIFEVDPTGTYTVSASAYNIYFLDEDLKILAKNSTTATVGQSPYTFDLPVMNGIKYVAVSWKKVTLAPKDFMAVKGSSLPASYLKYGFILNDNLTLSEAQKSEVSTLIASGGESYVVDGTGAGDYTSFTACLADLAGNTNEKTIYVKAGEYNIFTELGGQAWHQNIENQNKDYHELCPFVPENTHIIGVGKVIFNYLPTISETTQYMTTQISPVNMDTTSSIENITINCDNCRYAIHIETGSANENATINVKNMIINKTNTNGYAQALGCGGTTGTIMNIDNCFIKGMDGFSIHNNGSYTTLGMTINISNTTIKATRNPLRFSSVFVSGVDQVYINNSYFTKMVLSYESTLSTAKNTYNVIVTNCSDYDLIYKYEYDNEKPIQNFNNEILSITNEGSGHYSA